MNKVKCKDCKHDDISHCTIDDVFNEYTGEIISFTGKDKNKTGDCSKFEEIRA